MNMENLKEIQDVLSEYTFTQGQQKAIDSFLKIYENKFTTKEFRKRN